MLKAKVPHMLDVIVGERGSGQTLWGEGKSCRKSRASPWRPMLTRLMAQFIDVISTSQGNKNISHSNRNDFSRSSSGFSLRSFSGELKTAYTMNDTLLNERCLSARTNQKVTAHYFFSSSFFRCSKPEASSECFALRESKQDESLSLKSLEYLCSAPHPRLFFYIKR